MIGSADVFDPTCAECSVGADVCVIASTPTTVAIQHLDCADPS